MAFKNGSRQPPTLNLLWFCSGTGGQIWASSAPWTTAGFWHRIISSYSQPPEWDQCSRLILTRNGRPRVPDSRLSAYLGGPECWDHTHGGGLSTALKTLPSSGATSSLEMQHFLYVRREVRMSRVWHKDTLTGQTWGTVCCANRTRDLSVGAVFLWRHSFRGRGGL